ncbi:MAG: hypothetical protein WAO98_05025 [Alphaproteobacteria bacterium]
MARFRFPQNFKLADVRSALGPAAIVADTRGKDWNRSAFPVSINEESQDVSARHILEALLALQIKPPAIAELFRSKGFDITNNVMSARVSALRNERDLADDITKPKRRKLRAAAIEERPRARPTSHRSLTAEEEAARNERASLKIRLELKQRRNLSTAEFNHLPTFDFLVDVLRAMMFSNMHGAFNAAFKQMAEEGTGTVVLKGEGATDFHVCNDAAKWFHDITGLSKILNDAFAEDEPKVITYQPLMTQPEMVYVNLLEELVDFRRGKRQSDIFLAQLDERLCSVKGGLVETPLLWPERYMEPTPPKADRAVQGKLNFDA